MTLFSPLLPSLKNKDFHPLIVQQIRNRFFGYKIASEKIDERWVFTGPLQGFTAFYRKKSTAPWPNITEFLFEDSRKNIRSPTLILPETGLPKQPTSESTTIPHVSDSMRIVIL